MKFQKLRNDNRGLTLVELIVAVAISTLVVGAIWQFVLVSTRTYESQKTETQLQQEVQQTMNQLENILIDTDRAIEYSYTDDKTNYTSLSSDYNAPENKYKRLEVYNDNMVSRVEWDNVEKTLVYNEGQVASNNNSVSISGWESESPILAEGVEELAIDVSQLAEKQVVKVKITFARNNKTYTATRSIAVRNDIINSGNLNEIYGDSGNTAVNPLSISISGVSKVWPRETHKFEATVLNSGVQVNGKEILWTIQGATSEDTNMNLTTGELVIGSDESAHSIYVIATLKDDRTVTQLKELEIGDKNNLMLTIVDERPENNMPVGAGITSPVTDAQLESLGCTEVINVLCGESYRVPLRADLQPFSVNEDGSVTKGTPVTYYSDRSWNYRALGGGVATGCEVATETDTSGNVRRYLEIDDAVVDDFILEAVVDTKEAALGKMTGRIYVNVIPPTVDIQLVSPAVNTTSAPYYASGQTGLTADQLPSFYPDTKLEVRAVYHSIENAEAGFGYKGDIFTQGEFTWTYTYINEQNQPVTATLASKNSTATMNLPAATMKKIFITATTQQYSGLTFPNLYVGINKPTITALSATVAVENGTALTLEDYLKKTENLDTTYKNKVDVYKNITFTPTYVGGSYNDLSWKIIIGNNTYEITPQSTGVNLTKNSTASSLVINTGSGYVGEGNSKVLLEGKTIAVVVTDKYGMALRKEFTIVDEATCEEKVNSFTSVGGNGLNYLHPGYGTLKNYENYAFTTTIDSSGRDIKIGKVYVCILNQITEYSHSSVSSGSDYIMSHNLDGNKITFTPNPNYSKRSTLTGIIYDIDDAVTGKHLGYIRLNTTACNYNADGVDIYRPNTTLGKPGLFQTKDDVKDLPLYCNYYGYENMKKTAALNLDNVTSVTYKCKFKWYNGLLSDTKEFSILEGSNDKTVWDGGTF